MFQQFQPVLINLVHQQQAPEYLDVGRFWETRTNLLKPIVFIARKALPILAGKVVLTMTIRTCANCFDTAVSSNKLIRFPEITNIEKLRFGMNPMHHQ